MSRNSARRENYSRREPHGVKTLAVDLLELIYYLCKLHRRKTSSYKTPEKKHGTHRQLTRVINSTIQPDQWEILFCHQ